MEVSTEISQKIRSAIKAKLMELGAYVDDELPDYIMVMVANKRSRTQMNKDLGLFLGTHTSLFTQWLHSLLVKLQTIKSDLDKSADKHGKGGKLKAVRNKQKGGRQVVDGLASITKDQESVHSAEDCVEKTQPDSGSGEGDKYQHVIDSREAGSSTKLIIKTEKDDNHNVRPDTITSPVDAISEEGEAMETEVVTSRSLGIDTNITSKMSSASQSPGHMQSYSVNRKRKMTPELGDTGKESGVFHPYNPAFDTTTSELTTDNSPSLQVTRALLLQAVAEVEHSIAVKRRVSVTKPVCRDYSSEEYTPKRKWSYDCLHEESPPPYVFSKISVVDGSSHVDCVYKSKETRHSKCLPAHEDCRELISRCRREELLRSIGIVRDTSLPPGSFKPLATDMSCQKGDNKFTGKREVRDGNSSKNIQNFQITNSLASGGSSQVEKHPPPLAGSSLHVPEGSASYKGTRTSITSRLGKLHMENKDLFDDDDGLDARNSRTGDLLFNSKLRDTINSINAQEKLNLIKSQKSASISSPYQEQHEKYFSSLTSRKHECSRSVSTGVFSGASSQSKRVEYTPRIPEGVVVQLQHQHSQETPPGKVQSYNLGDGEDPAEAGDQEPPLLVKNFSGDSRFDSDVNATRQSAEDDMKKHEQEGTRRGITFIVTLDGVDESQFHSEHAGEGKFGCEVDKSRQPVFEKVHTGHIGNMGSLSEKIECPVVSASVAVAPVVTSGLKQLCREHKLLDLQTAVARPEHLTFFQKVQSLKRAAVDPFLLPTESHPALHCLRDLGDDDAKLASLQTLGHYSTEVMLDEDDESTHQQQKLERCKFWPACAAGDSCGYYHPTTHCKMFPNCRFGDKCLFIHPNCRFDSTCVRPDCPYTHSSRRRPACVKRSVALHKSHNVLTPMPKPRFPGPSYSGSQSTCRYFPNCRNGNCPFVHPKPCRFGLACKSLSCPFLHPNVPDKRMLKWQARCGKMEDVPLTASSNFKSAGFRDHSSTRTSKSTKVSSTSR